MNNKILITGGAGFVGQALVKLFNGYNIHVVDNLKSGSHRLDNLKKTDLHFHDIDLCNAEAVDVMLKRINPDIIIHLAAIHFIPECEQFPKKALEHNVNVTINLLDSCKHNCRFIYTSSAAVYAPSLSELLEDFSTICPNDFYGHNKLHGEHYVKLYSQKKNLDGISVRLFNVIGPGETNPHVLPEIIYQLKCGSKSLNLGNIDNQRDFIDVDDAATGFFKLAMLKEKYKTNEIVNLGSGKTYSISDILDIVKDVTCINFDVKLDQSKIRKVDNPLLLASTIKLHKMLNWSPNTNVQDTISKIWNCDEELKNIFV